MMPWTRHWGTGIHTPARAMLHAQLEHCNYSIDNNDNKIMAHKPFCRILFNFQHYLGVGENLVH